MIEKITLRMFWVSMLSCAVFVLILLWIEGDIPEAVFKIAPTLFIIGFANFLIWAPMVVYRFLNKKDSRSL